jgi:hypothetical protein
MPELSRFVGIFIRFNYREHPPAHFHAEYAEFRVQISIESHAIIQGRLPARVLGLVQEWAELHHDELTECWRQVQNHQVPQRIAPLV